MADDPTRYLDVSGVLALKAGSTVDVDYTVTHATSVAARLGELGADIRQVSDDLYLRVTDAAAESEARDDTLAARIDSELTRLTTTHMTRTDDGRIAFQQGGVLPVSRASDGRLVVAA